MEKEQEVLKIGEDYESKPDGTLVYKSPILSKDTREVVGIDEKYSLQGTTQGRYLTGGVPPVRFSM